MTDPKMRRRYIYMVDEDWERIRAQATERSITMSEIIRQAFGTVSPIRERSISMSGLLTPAGARELDPPGFHPAPKPVRKKR